MKFGSNKQQNKEANVGKVTVLSMGFELTGDIISKSDIRADGILVGSIRTDKKWWLEKKLPLPEISLLKK